MSGLLAPDALRRILKRADTKQAAWQEVDQLRAHIAALEKERDAALADNAAKIETIQRMRNLLLYPTIDAEATRLEVLRLGLDAVTHPGPGAALLEEHRTQLAQVALARDMSAAMHEAAQKARMQETEEHRKAVEARDEVSTDLLCRLTREQADLRVALVRARNDGWEGAAKVVSNLGFQNMASMFRSMKEPE